MASNYSPQLPKDKSGETIQNSPAPIVAKVTTGYAPPAASSVVSFGANTTVVEVTALSNALALKWGSASVIATAGATANFDHIVPVNTTRRFTIPQQTAGMTGSVVGANTLNGLYTTMAVISAASVIAGITEY